jgi:hypothetical protein
MAWWSTNVVGGDPALDILAGLGDELGVELYPLPEPGAPEFEPLRQALGERAEAFERAVRAAGADADDGQVAYQVAAAVVMAAGAPMPGWLAAAGLDAARNDAWAGRSRERAESMRKFAGLLDRYDGTPTAVEHEGLLERMGRDLGG